MNDATGPVGGEPWLAPDADPHAGPPEAGHEAGWREPFLDPARDLDPGLAGFEHVDWQAWAAADPQGAEAAWAAAQRRGEAPDAESDTDRAERLEAAHAELARDIEGWSPRMAADLAVYAQARGFTAEELAGVEDPREVKILHLAMLGEQAMARQAHEQRFGRFRPPTQLGGAGHPGHLSDRSSTEAWMRARTTQLRKKART